MANREKVNKTIRGATRSGQRKAPKQLAGSSVVSKLWLWMKRLTGISLLVAVAYFSGQWLLQQWDRPVARVTINGEFSRVQRNEVADRIYDAMGASFIGLNLEKIQTELEQMAWVDSARVARTWPDGLDVTVIEHKPIARWGERDALNHRGEVIELSGNNEAVKQALLDGLPQLIGTEGKAPKVMAQYHTLTKLLAEHGLTIEVLSCDAGNSWSMELSEGVSVRIGRDQVLDKVGRFLLVFEAQLQQRWAELDSVDLRYFNGVAVHWRDRQAAPETVLTGKGSE